MPRRKRVVAPIPTTSLVSSATRYTGKKSARIYQPQQNWQAEAYRQYHICGEARFAAKFFGNALSKTILGASDTSAEATLEELFNGPDGQAQMLEAIGTHLTIAGECYLVGRTVHEEDYPDTELWEIISVLEMKVTGKKWKICYGAGLEDVELTDEDVVIRIWMPSPGRRIEADSAFRSLLPILSEIEWLTKHIFRQTTSRLAGAGILFMPSEMEYPPPPEVDGEAQTYANKAEGFTMTLGDGMLTPLENPESPAATVPIVVTAPGDMIDKPRLMHFWSELDAAALEMRQEAIRRFALGMDLPPEQVLGMSSNSGTGGGTSNGVSHWGAWQIEEQTIKLHIEPMCELISNALSIGYLRPGSNDATATVTYDLSALRLRPDRSQESIELYDRGWLSGEVMLRENGFDPVLDAPTEKEFHSWLLRKIASGSATPEQVNEALNQLGVDLGPMPELTQVNESRPDPSLDDHPTNPRTPNAVLLAACEPLVFRALERAGNRIRNNGARPPGVPAYETHLYAKANDPAAVLEDAWSCAHLSLEGIADPSLVVPVLNSYVLTLLREGAAHNRGRLAQWLQIGEVA